MKRIRLIWQCNHCKDVVISYSYLQHDMNVCDCGKSGLDLENDYQRTFGSIKEISRKEFNGEKWVKLP